MRYFYNLVFYLVFPAILLRLLWRSRKNSAYAKRWRERFGWVNLSCSSRSVWVHAVSVGEAIAAIPLIQALQQQNPTVSIIVTTTTVTGSERIRTVFSNQVLHIYAPYDLPHMVRRFLRKIRPRLVIIMETELWPNLLYFCEKDRIPVFLANARLSERSAKKYAIFKSFTQQMLKRVTLLAAQTQEDADRFIGLGMDATRIQVTGSIKFDLHIPPDLHEKAQELRQYWGTQRPVWIAASTHAGEEEKLLIAFRTLKTVFPDVLLLLVPRHPERFTKVIVLCRKHGFCVVTRSQLQLNQLLTCTQEADIFIGDSMGELLLFYAAADVAFVGGSLVPKGGHNLLEPAALGLPVVIGPHSFNFSVITQQLVKQGAAWQVQDIPELVSVISVLLRDKSLCHTAGEKGRQFVEKHRGAVERQLQLLISRGILE